MKKLLGLSLLLNGLLLASWSWRELPVEAQGAGVGGGQPCGTENGDVNGDRRRDLSDPIYMLSWLFTSGPEPVPVCDQGGVILRIKHVNAFGDCMPIVPPDPWAINWELEVANTSGQSATIELDSAQVAFGDPANPTFETSMEATPAMVEVDAGAIASFTFTKTAFSTAPGCNLCGQPVTLNARYRIDGVPAAPVNDATKAQCAF